MGLSGVNADVSLMQSEILCLSHQFERRRGKQTRKVKADFMCARIQIREGICEKRGTSLAIRNEKRGILTQPKSQSLSSARPAQSLPSSARCSVSTILWGGQF